MSRIEAWIALAVAISATSRAGADEAPRARALFQEGRALMAQGRYAEACPKLEESERLDPGVGTQFNLARCYELEGRLASAWKIYTDVVTATHAAGQTAREVVARERVAELEPRLAYVVIVRSRTDASNVRILYDGVELTPSMSRIELPVDPGAHEVRATQPRKRDWQQPFTITRERERVTIEVRALEDAAPAPAPAPSAMHRTPPPTELGPARVVALVVAGGSAVSLGAGAYFGLRALALKNDANRGHCDASGCDPDVNAARKDSKNTGNLSTATFAIGGALAIAAGILWFTASSSAPDRPVQVAPTIGASSAGIVVGARWR